ncbi:MAG TPA: hypothetical protein VLK84_03450 [Longimicrobium sp.]|nr:hypothetical protein [Longimicrobium sp.]
MSLRSRLTRFAPLALLAALLGACGDGPSGPPPALSITATGTLQRGATVTLAATRDGQPVPAANVTWTVTPATAGELLPGGQLRLLAAGALEVRGSYDGSTGTAQLQVAELGALVISATGTLKRGSTVTLSVSRDGQVIPTAQVAWTVTPATAAELLPGGQLRLLAAGTLEVRGSYDGSTGSTQLQVADLGPLVISAAGRAERGSTLALTVTRDGQAIPAGDVTWTLQPAAAGEVLPGGQVRLLATGALEIRGSFDGSTGALPVTVAAPPTVVFDMSVGGNRDLYSVELDGGGRTRLTEDPSVDNDPSVAAGKILFVSVRAGNPELYLMNASGGAATRITSTAARSELSPALSPDGTRIAYTYDVSGVARIWTANVNGTGAAAFTGGLGFAGSPETAPSWAPTGNRLAFVGTGQGTADIWDLTAGGTASILAGGDSAEVDPAWNPAGTHVAFASTREGDPAIFLVRVSDRTITKLSTRAGGEAEPTWTADGRLVYVEFGAGSTTRLVWIDPAQPTMVHEIPVAGGNPRRPSVVR